MRQILIALVLLGLIGCSADGRSVGTQSSGATKTETFDLYIPACGLQQSLVLNPLSIGFRDPEYAQVSCDMTVPWQDRVAEGTPWPVNLTYRFLDDVGEEIFAGQVAEAYASGSEIGLVVANIPEAEFWEGAPAQIELSYSDAFTLDPAQFLGVSLADYVYADWVAGCVDDTALPSVQTLQEHYEGEVPGNATYFSVGFPAVCAADYTEKPTLIINNPTDTAVDIEILTRFADGSFNEYVVKGTVPAKGQFEARVDDQGRDVASLQVTAAGDRVAVDNVFSRLTVTVGQASFTPSSMACYLRAF